MGSSLTVARQGARVPLSDLFAPYGAIINGHTERLSEKEQIRRREQGNQ